MPHTGGKLEFFATFAEKFCGSSGTLAKKPVDNFVHKLLPLL
ncbi:hypothetical protein A464_4048 [Salmonella bongori N268-08]|uniref:Uncharacterized protein n=1 Tax=Salmonella bongori N268-08 TaxID=1197719 RepID=S5NLV4_SALBN|nr:hypothetical protein A464_4048 [Salmonella bongori N268-08]